MTPIEPVPPTAASRPKPAVLAYAVRSKGVHSSGRDVPMSWLFMLLAFGVWTWPFWVTLVDFDVFLFGYALHLFYGCLGGIFVLIPYGVRVVYLSDALPQPIAAARSAARRRWLVPLASLLFIAAHAMAVPQRLVFAMHYRAFENAKDAALAAMKPGDGAGHASIGPYAIDDVRCGYHGQIAFHAGDSGMGTAFIWTPTPELEPDPLYYPPNGGGRLFGGWWYVVTD